MYSQDFRILSLKLFLKHRNFSKVRSTVQISASTVHRWLQGAENSRQNSHRRRSRIRRTPDRSSEIVRAALSRRPVSTINDMRCVLADEGISRCRQTVSLVILSVSRGNEPPHASEAGLAIWKKVRAFKCALFPHFRSSGRTVVSVDECCFPEKVLPSYGYAPRG
mmetsp:Transcript_291/g.2331  ORF Transcript_291/g.2331 Transcript_291/m.2331 type:complete len:165 (+) Transcript_291:4018-4512(+)